MNHSQAKTNNSNTIAELSIKLNVLAVEIGIKNIYAVMYNERTLLCVFGMFRIHSGGEISIELNIGYSVTEFDHRGNKKKCHMTIEYPINHWSVGKPIPDLRECFKKYGTDIDTVPLVCNLDIASGLSIDDCISKVSDWIRNGVYGQQYSNEHYCHLTAIEYKDEIKAAAYFAQNYPDLWSGDIKNEVTKNTIKRKGKFPPCKKCGKGRWGGNKFCPSCGEEYPIAE